MQGWGNACAAYLARTETVPGLPPILECLTISKNSIESANTDERIREPRIHIKSCLFRGDGCSRLRLSRYVQAPPAAGAPGSGGRVTTSREARHSTFRTPRSLRAPGARRDCAMPAASGEENGAAMLTDGRPSEVCERRLTRMYARRAREKRRQPLRLSPRPLSLLSPLAVGLRLAKVYHRRYGAGPRNIT